MANPELSSRLPDRSLKSPVPLRLAIAADPRIAVPPKLYGGIERVVDMLVRGLLRRGHHVTLFAHPDSSVACRRIPYPCPSADGWWGTLRISATICRQVLRERFDLVHSFGRLATLVPLLPFSAVVLESYQRTITARSVALGEKLARLGTLHFSGCSRQLLGEFWGRPNWHVVYNGVPADTFHFRPQVAADAPLMFLGRVEHVKGVDLAIQVARKSGRRLTIAGNIEEAHRGYFEECVAPQLSDRITYVGPVSDAQKNELLGESAALLMPIRLEEPFGIVMAEALACGTPVVGLARGAVPEIVQDGLNGFVCGDVDEMVEAVRRLPEIDRQNCRRIMEENFSDTAIVDAYERLYYEILGRR